jgi:hypothetical protein
MTKQKPANISFSGLGTRNSGNEATLLAISSRFLLRFPTCEFCCICSLRKALAGDVGPLPSDPAHP